MKQLRINWQSLELAFDQTSDELGLCLVHYLDRETGEVIVVDDYTNKLVEQVEQVADELDESDEVNLADLTEDEFRELISET
jgi:hypothetical protein